MQSKIGFIGLGAMGKPMAANIAKAGFELTVCDLREEPCKELAALGARVVASPREVAEKSDIIEIAVVDDAQAERVVTGGAWGDSWRASGIDRGDSQHDPSRRPREKLLPAVVPMESK